MEFNVSNLRYVALFIVAILLGLVVSSSFNRDPDSSEITDYVPLSANPIAPTAANGAPLPSLSPEDMVISYQFEDEQGVITMRTLIDAQGGIEYQFEDLTGVTRVRQFDDNVTYLYNPVAKVWEISDTAFEEDLAPSLDLVINQEQLDSFNSLAAYVEDQECATLKCAVWEVGNDDAGAAYRVSYATKKIYDFTSLDSEGNAIIASFDYKYVDVKLESTLAE